jgi:23S rRNA-/tRNA-specific pseudouridylate synthase
MNPTPVIIHLDAQCVVVCKPHNLPVDMGDTPYPSLKKWIENELRQRGERISPWGIHPVHFIDRAVSGIVVFARNTSSFSNLQLQFQKRKVKKVYVAVTQYPLPVDKGKLIHHHKRTHDGKCALIRDIPDKHTRQVDLLYTKIDHHTYKIQLGSGKYHQIRAQLAYVGAPIVGDTLYTTEKIQPEQILLCATEISFFHPKSMERLSFFYTPDWL